MKKKYSFLEFNYRKFTPLMIVGQCIVCICLLCGYGYGQLLEKTFTATIKKGALIAALEQMRQASHVDFTYQPNQLKGYSVDSKTFRQTTTGDALQTLLDGSDLEFVEMGKSVLIRKKINSSAQPIMRRTQTQDIVRGQVVDSLGNGISNVSVQLVGSTGAGTQTDQQGDFSLEIQQAGQNHIRLIFSKVGFLSRQIATEPGAAPMKVVLVAQDMALEEVVVVGYGTQKKINLTGAVSQIDGSVLADRPLTNVAQGLQGQIPNLNITFSDGKPGRSATFNVRGMNSINGGDPLILIDGVPGDINILNPADIATVSVLKDAASASIYGARGAFGVILVTTKNGSTGKPQIQYSNNFAWSTPTRIPKLYLDDPVRYAEIQDSAAGGPGWQVNPYYMTYLKERQQDPTLPEIKAGKDANGNDLWVMGGNTDWYALLFNKKAPMQQHQLNISGGQDKLTYYLSGGFVKQDGILKEGTDKFDRYNLRTKINSQITDWLKVYNFSEFSKSKYDQPNTYMQYNLNVFRMLSQNANVYNVAQTPDGVWTDAGVPIGFLRDGGRKNDMNWLFRNTAGADFQFLKKQLNLHVDYTYQLDGLVGTERRIAPLYSPSPGVVKEFPIDDPNSYKKGTSNNNQSALNIYGDYRLDWKQHHFKVLVGFNQENRKDSYYYVTKNNIVSDEYESINLGTGTLKAGDSETSWALRGTFFRFTYDYDQRYLLEVNGRYDLTSRFPKRNRGGFFPSASAGWVISNEPFLKERIPALSLLKLRASYGSLGNQLVSNYGYMSTMGVYLSPTLFDGQQVSTTSAPAPVQENINWETARTMNFGLDLGFLQNRLNGTFEWYRRQTLDMLVEGSTPPSVYGATSPRQNAADMETHGWEASVKWSDKVGNGDGAFGYDIGLVLSDNLSKITRYPGNPNKYLGTWTNASYYEGQTVGEIWGYRGDGFFTGEEKGTTDYSSIYASFKPTAGDLKFKDINGDNKVSKGANTATIMVIWK